MNIRTLPGPKPKLENGNGDDINASGDMARFQLNAHQEYGSNITFMLDKDTPAFSTTNPEDVKTALKLSHKPESFYKFTEPVIGDILERGEFSLKLRALITNRYSSELIRQYSSVLETILDTEIGNWLQE